MKKIKLPLPSLKKKKKGADGEEQPKKKLSKKNLLIIIVVLLLAAVAAKFTVFKDGIPPLPFGGGGGSSQAEAKLPDPVDAYCLLDDSVASISSSFGAAETAAEGTEGEEGEEKKEDKKDKKDKEDKEDKAAKGAKEVLLSMSTSYVPKAEGEEGEEGKEESAKEEEPAEESDILEANKPEGEYGYYYYRVGAGTEGTLAEYREFLLDDGFKLLENANAKPYVTKYQKEGVTPKKYFNLEIEYPLGGDEMTGMYAIRVSMEDKPDPVEKEAVGRAETLEYFNTLSQEKLGLPKPVSEYYVVMDMGRTFVDGHDCHGISLYEKGNGAGNYFIKKFYLSLEDKKLFEYMGDSIYTMEYNPQTGQTSTTISDDFNRQTVNSGGTVHDWNIGPVE